MCKNNFLFSVFFTLLHLYATAENIDVKGTAWISDFFQKEVQSVVAEYNLKTISNPNASEHYYKRMAYSVEYTASAKTYTLRFVYEYREDWNILTDHGSHAPASEPVYYTDSKISPWTNSNGLGVYSEVYQRTIPNWLNFTRFDSLMVLQGRLGNPRPPITGLFYSDELKALKKLYKEELSLKKKESIISCFEFDQAGNVIEISKSYLDEFREDHLKVKKPIEDYSIVIRNKADDVLFVRPVLHASEFQILEGVSLKSGDKKIRVFNFELNYMLHKFMPDLISDPKVLIDKYLMALQKVSQKDFVRFQHSAEKQNKSK